MTPYQGASSEGPRFSLVVATYNVAPYLPDFISSIENQSFDLSQVEIIMVDDGSTDESAQILREWQKRRPELVTLMAKENGGQSSARNLGLTIASGGWVTFPDPDDMLGENYLSEVALFLDRNSGTEMVGTNRLLLEDKTGIVADRHPLRKHFATRNRLMNLDLRPTFFFGSAPAAFFKRERLDELGLRFDERIRPNFEDGHFCVSYLLASPKPLVAFVRSATYIYRKREDLSSTLQNSTTHPGRYTDVLEFGYIDVLRKAQEKTGHVPFWLQNYVLYEMYWYLRAENAIANSLTAATGSVADRFHELMPQLLEYLEPGVISSFRVKPFMSIWRDILNHSWNTEPWHGPYAVISKYDEGHQLAQVTYRYVGAPPREQFFIGEDLVEPQHGKHRRVHMFDRTLIHERITWVPTKGPLSLRLNGKLTEFVPDWPRATAVYLRRDRLRRLISEDPSDQFRHTQRATSQEAVEEEKRTLRAKEKLLRQASSRRMTRRFKDAWVLMDRVHDADDSGEHLFQYLHDTRPDINAWFVIERKTADWDRLQAAGYGRRMVAYGSDTWRILIANCKVLISSHADAPITNPPAINKLIDRNWRFVFLQHGVIKDDISNWLNGKNLDLFVTSTPNELASVAGDETGYIYTTKETKLTELPRFDLILEKGQEYPPEERDLVLIAPTWRNWLTASLDPGSQRRTLRDDFFRTEFAKNWLGFLSSEQLAETAAQHNLHIAFLPHPNLQSALAEIELPEHVMPLSFAGQDIRSHFARAAAFITDYSSMAFNVAYIERPVIYFQFDQEEMFGGAHVGRGGYYDYGQQGFGPVTDNLASAIEATVRTINDGPQPSPHYIKRIQATFPYRDGHARERVTAEIEGLFTPPTDGTAPTPTPRPDPTVLDS